MKDDPPVRADGNCYGCGAPRRITAQAQKYAGVQLELDPWCSSKCCRAWHGTALPLTGQERRALAELENDKVLVNV